MMVRAETARRSDSRKGQSAAPILWLRDTLLLWTSGYGYRPFRAVAWLLVFWAVGVAVFWNAERQGVLMPNQAVVLRAPEWTGCFRPELAKRFGLGQSQYACFLERPEAQFYPRFNPWIYSVDTLLPLVDLESQSNWTPNAQSAPGKVVLRYLWVHILVGWALSLLALFGALGLLKPHPRHPED